MNSNKALKRITRNTPAMTSVEECISAEAGVGASIASGNQTCEKNCAPLIAPAIAKENAISETNCMCQPNMEKKYVTLKGSWIKIAVKSVV